MADTSIGILGAGAITTNFYLPAVIESWGCIKHVHVVDRSTERAKSAASRLPNASVHRDYNDIASVVDGVIVALPNSLHYEAGKYFLEHNTPVLIEKPLAQNYKDAVQLVQISDNTGNALAVNNTRRLYPNFKKIKSIIRNGGLGDVLKVCWIEGDKFSWPAKTGHYVTGKSRGVIADKGAHVLDILSWWLGPNITLRAAKDDSEGGPEAYAELLLSTDDNTDVKVVLSWISELKNDCRVELEKGEITFEPYGWKRLSLKRDSVVREHRVGSHVDSYSWFGAQLVKDFAQVCSASKDPLVDGSDVTESIRLIEDCYQNRSSITKQWT